MRCVAWLEWAYSPQLPTLLPQELEDALLLDCEETPSSLLVHLFCNFLNGIVDKEIT